MTDRELAELRRKLCGKTIQGVQVTDAGVRIGLSGGLVIEAPRIGVLRVLVEMLVL